MATEAPPISPASAPPAPAGITPSNSGQTIFVESGPLTERPAPKAGTARADLINDLRKKAGLEPEVAPPEKKSEPATKAKGKTEAPKSETPTKPESTAKPQEGQTEKPTADKTKTEKANPWKLADEYKARAAKAEARIAELEKGRPNPEQEKNAKEHFQAMQQRLQELESEIKFANFTKSREFQEKYQKPYEQAWQRAMSNLAEIEVVNPDRSTRTLNAEDILELVNKPLAEAKAVAEEKFGDFAPEVMAERKEIKKLWDAQNDVLVEAKKFSEDRDKQIKSQIQSTRETITREVQEAWQEAQEAINSDERFAHHFKPIDGDEEGNTALEKGFSIVDKAWSVNPTDPRLTPEQRREAVKRQAIIRNRAAVFGRHTLQINKLKTKVAELEKKLSDYEGTEPDVTGREQGSGAPAPKSVREEVFGAFTKFAK